MVWAEATQEFQSSWKDQDSESENPLPSEVFYTPRQAGVGSVL